MEKKNEIFEMRRKLETEIYVAKKPLLIYQFCVAECIERKRRWASGVIHVQRFVQTFRIVGRRTYQASVIYAAQIIAQIGVACVARFVGGQIASGLVGSA